MIDFDVKFHNYYEKWIKENTGRLSYDEMEDRVPQVYEEWLNTYDEEIGSSPCVYLKNLSRDELMSDFISSFEDGKEPASALLDEIENREDCLSELKTVLSSDVDAVIKIHAANMLLETGHAGDCLDVFTRWVISPVCDADLRDVAVEILKDYASLVYDELINAVPNADNDTKTLIAEIIICAPENDKTYNLLEELFKSGSNTALYAGYLAKYGDVRAASMLYKALDNCNYLEFTEIRNAIEILGGVVDDDYRDFSDDEYYKAIKHLK